MSRPMTPKTAKRRSARGSLAAGFTMIEATIALMMMLIGIMGMGAFAAATVRQNMDAQDMTEAANLAQRIAAQLRTEAAVWNRPVWDPALDTSNVATYMPLLGRLTAAAGATGEGWAEATRFMTNVTGGASRAFTRDLSLVAPNSDDAKFCVHYNLTWLQVNETIRADIRVYWRRRAAPNPNGFRGDCGAADPGGMAANITELRSYSLPVTLSRNVGG